MNVILDTNVCLHYDFAAANWSEFVSASNVTIWFTWVNLHELDHIKDSHHNLKRRARARSVLKHVEGMISGTALPKLSGNARLQFYEEQPTVDWSTLELDRSNADHRLVATAIIMRDAVVDPVVLITHDVTPRIAARLHGLVALDMPAKWRLPSSEDGEDRERRKLQKEVDRLKSRLPIIVVNLPDGDGVRFDCAPLVVPADDTLEEVVRIETERYKPKDSTKRKGLSAAGKACVGSEQRGSITRRVCLQDSAAPSARVDERHRTSYGTEYSLLFADQEGSAYATSTTLANAFSGDRTSVKWPDRSEVSLRDNPG